MTRQVALSISRRGFSRGLAVLGSVALAALVGLGRAWARRARRPPPDPAIRRFSCANSASRRSGSCAAWGMARSSFYAMTSGQHAEQPPAKRRGPKPAISDEALLVAIEADLEASPWEGEGYRKVWARLRVCRDIRVARKRVLRLMRENNLLSPHRCRRRGAIPMTVRSSLEGKSARMRSSSEADCGKTRRHRHSLGNRLWDDNSGFSTRRGMSGLGVRRGKGGVLQWVQVPPGNYRSSRKQPEQSWR